MPLDDAELPTSPASPQALAGRRAVTLGDEWGCDTDQPLTQATARALAAATYQGHPLTFVWRYVSFTHPFAGDLTSLDTQAILDAGLTLLVVCHPPNPPWTASGQLGAIHGQWAARNASAAGYVAGMGLYLALDLEGLANAGQPVIDYANEWARSVSGGYRPCVYVGFDCGLTPTELYDLHLPDRYWSDPGNRQVAVRGVCCRQGATISMGGVPVDLDHAFPDALGGCLVGMRGAVAGA